jgi:hypothetical protein
MHLDQPYSLVYSAHSKKQECCGCGVKVNAYANRSAIFVSSSVSFARLEL